MALTRSFKETVQARILNDLGFGAELFAGAIECFIEGDVETGKSVLRDYINATLGFGQLAELVSIPGKSLMRMFSPGGNLQAQNLFKVTAILQEQGGFRIRAAAEYPKSEESQEAAFGAWFINGSCPSIFLQMDFNCFAVDGQEHVLEDWLCSNPWGQAKPIELDVESFTEICASLGGVVKVRV